MYLPFQVFSVLSLVKCVVNGNSQVGSASLLDVEVVSCLPTFVTHGVFFEITMDSPGCDIAIHTEADVICDAVM